MCCASGTSLPPASAAPPRPCARQRRGRSRNGTDFSSGRLPKPLAPSASWSSSGAGNSRQERRRSCCATANAMRPCAGSPEPFSADVTRQQNGRGPIDFPSHGQPIISVLYTKSCRTMRWSSSPTKSSRCPSRPPWKQCHTGMTRCCAVSCGFTMSRAWTASTATRGGGDTPENPTMSQALRIHIASVLRHRDHPRGLSEELLKRARDTD